MQSPQTWNWESSLEKSGRFSEKTIHNITDSNNLLNHRRSSCKNSRGNTTVCRFLKSIWFHKQREVGANTSSLWSPQRNHYSHNDALQKHENQGSHTGWRHRYLLHCFWTTAHLFKTCLNYIHQTSIDLIKEGDFKLKKVKKQMI